ncbi:hypothetical protein ACFFHJ_25870 [Planotetraspora thailandica]|uniref:adenylyl cyclase n=1 Tax=Planotetraspora thailandica TaxID=487172 RepID=UPI00194FBECC|nr:adenylyl cyclase [Planotetraspora thailandica]
MTSRRGTVVRRLAVAASAVALTAAGLAPMTGTAAATTNRQPDFGPNVFVYDPSTPAAEIQAKFDQLFAQQEENEMGTNRYAVLFKPGQYDVNAKLGYYTTVAGLGRSPDDVDVHGAVRVIGQPDPGSAAGISALTNFWRSAENLSVTPTDWSNQWAVSQASPMRRVHIKGILWLEPGNGGYSSGGYIADSKIDGITINGSQQQWLTRDSVLGDAWTNGVWNQVFSGVTGAPQQGFPNPPYTTLATSPVTREKPYLYVDDAGRYRVFLPALRHNTSGTTWDAGQQQQGSSVSIDDFYIAKPGDSAAKINLALLLGKNLLLTPGVYHLDQPIHVLRKNTVILGLGMPSLAPDTGKSALEIADVDGVRVAGVLVDAGKKESKTLVKVGGPLSHRDHSANPISLQDVFFRIGGPWVGKAETSLEVNADDTLIDNIWAWRGDHGNGIGWTQNTADTGVVINGDDVTAYGLFVEHYQKYQTIWNGERGRTIFYQSEMPYDPPSQAAWTSPTGKGYASYKVGKKVKSHEAWGLGVYSYFNQGVDIRADRGIEAPQTPKVRFHDMITVFLDGSGGIERTINDAGTPVVGSYGTSTIVDYP